MWLGVCLWGIIDQVSEIQFMLNSSIHRPVQVALPISTVCTFKSKKDCYFCHLKINCILTVKCMCMAFITRVFGTGPANIYSKILIYVLHPVNTLFTNDEAPTPSLIHSNSSVSKHTVPPPTPPHYVVYMWTVV
jgi:hypothetical protein